MKQNTIEMRARSCRQNVQLVADCDARRYAAGTQVQPHDIVFVLLFSLALKHEGTIVKRMGLSTLRFNRRWDCVNRSIRRHAAMPPPIHFDQPRRLMLLSHITVCAQACQLALDRSQGQAST